MSFFAIYYITVILMTICDVKLINSLCSKFSILLPR